jgi:hypothetical protein
VIQRDVLFDEGVFPGGSGRGIVAEPVVQEDYRKTWLIERFLPLLAGKKGEEM